MTKTQLYTEQDLDALCHKVEQGDSAAAADLYELLEGLRWYFRRQLGADLAEDALHDLWVELVPKLSCGAVRDPGKLLGYVHTVARRQVLRIRAAQSRTLPLDHSECRDAAPDPESTCGAKESHAIAMRILLSLPDREREMLVRFYLKEQTPSQIQSDLGLTPTQFRLVKSRAKMRYEHLCKAALQRGS